MLSAEVLDAMVAAGCTAEQIASAVKAACAADERKQAENREKARVRKQSSRANKAEVTADDTVSQVVTVTERDNAGHNVTACDTGEVVSLSPVPLLSPHTPLITPLPPNPSEKQTTRAHRLPENWTLQGPDLAYALSKGLTEAETGDLAEKFSSWAWSASGPNAKKVNWHRAFQGWVQRDAAKIIGSRAGPARPAKPLTPYQQQQAATKNVVSALRGTNPNGAGNGSPSDRVLPIDQRQQPGDLRGGHGGAVLAVSRAHPGGSDRSG